MEKVDEKAVREEIARLEKSPYVKLGREEKKLMQRLYMLRHLEKVGKEVAKRRKGEEK